MSRGKNLQEMETDTTQSRTAVNANAKAAEPMQKLTPGITPGQTGNWEDLGGPTPENYRPDDDSAKLITPTGTLKSVQNVVTKGAKSAEAMQKMKEELEEDEDELLESTKDEEEDDEDEDEDEDGDNDFADNMIARMVASGMSREEAIKKVKNKDYNKKSRTSRKDPEDEDLEDEEDPKSVKETFAQLEEQIEEDVDALLEGEDLSEEFRDKAKLIFETAINSKISEIYESLEQRYEEELLEEVDSMKGQLVERVDAYLEYVADEWLQENALVVEQGLKTEMTESFLQGMKSLFEDHYVSIPEEKYDVVESMVDKLDEMEGKLNEQIERNVALNRRLSESVADVIFSQISEGLATSQKDKLASLSENVEFESETNYRDKLVTLRESYFPKYASNQRDHSEILSEEMNYDEPVSGIMESYLQTLSRVSRK